MATDSENEWNPLSRPRFDEILAEEVAGLPPDARKIFDDNSPKLATNPVAVEKLRFQPKWPKSGDVKCLEIREERLKRFLTQFCFCDFRPKEFFNCHS